MLYLWLSSKFDSLDSDITVHSLGETKAIVWQKSSDNFFLSLIQWFRKLNNEIQCTHKNSGIRSVDKQFKTEKSRHSFGQSLNVLIDKENAFFSYRKREKTLPILLLNISKIIFDGKYNELWAMSTASKIVDSFPPEY